MATDHDFKIKNGAQIENGFLLIGKEALSSSEGYMGMKTSNMTGTNDYMIISGTGDNSTYLSAKDGASVYIRGGGNASGHQLKISSTNAQFYGNLQIDGNLTVNGTTLTVDTTNLQVQDNNITLNYSTGDSSSSANGAGITIQDAVDSSTDATILWSQAGGNFNVSHGWNSLGYLQHSGVLYSRNNLLVLNSAGNGWNTWATRSGGQFNLSVGTIASGAITSTGSITGTYFLASGADSTPAGTGFSNVFKGSNARTVYFDSGDGSSISTWYGSGNTPFAAIDANNGILRLYVNDTSGNWNERIQMNSSGITHYGTTTVISNNVHLDSTGSAYYRADGATNSWKYLSLQTNGSTSWDIATKNDDLSGALQFRPGGGPTNRTSMSTAGDWTFDGRITVGDTAETQKVVLNFDSGGNMILGNDGSYGTTGNGRYTTLGFGGTTNGVNRIFAHNGTADGLYLAAATGAKVKVRANGLGSDTFALGIDDSYSGYASLGFGGGLQNGYNRIFASTGNSDGMYINAATGRGIFFRVNGNGSNVFQIKSDGGLYVGASAGTLVLDQSRNLTNIGTITNSGKISSSIGSNATYSRPLLEITSSGTPTQIKITTNIPYSGSGASTHAHSVTIRGFQYGSSQMADLQIGWHVYLNQFYNRSVTSSGSWAPTVTLAVENNKVVIHLASPGYWPKLYVESMYNAYGGAGQASGWSWSDAAISADANTPNVTVPYKFDYGNGVLMSGGTTIINSSRNLSNIGTISSGAITSTGNVEGASLETNHTITFGYNSHYLQAGTGSLFFKNNSNASLGGIDASGFNTPYGYQIAGTTVINSSRSVNNVTLGALATGARFEHNNWHQSSDGYNRFYFANASHTYFRTGSAYVFRDNGDTGRATISAHGGVNLLSGGDGHVASNVALAVGGTTVIDSSRNLTNIGTISSGAITANGGGNQSVIKSSSDAPLIVESTDAYSGINFKDTGGNSSMFYHGSSDHLYLHSAKLSVAGSTLASGYQFQVNGSANLTGSLAIGGTQVIAASTRNLTNIGTISSGAITATASGAVASFNRTDNDAIIELKRSGSIKGYIGANTSGDIKFYNSSAAGTFTISSAGNLSTAGNLSLDGGRAIFDTDTGTQPFQLNRIGIGTTHNQNLRMWVDDSYAVYESDQDETNRYGGHMFRSKHGSTAYTRFQITAGSTSEVLMYNNTGTATWQWDGNNSRQGINKLTPAYTLDVNGIISGSSYRVGATEVINSSGQFTGGLNPSSLSIGGTTVINSSRVGTFVSGTTIGSIELDGNSIGIQEAGILFQPSSSYRCIHPTSMTATAHTSDISLGWSNNKWKDIYLAGFVKADSGYQVGTTTVIDSSRNLTNIVGLYGSGGTLNHYNTDHIFKNTTSGLQVHINDTGVGIGIQNPSSALDIRGSGSGGSQKNTIAFGNSGWGGPLAPNAALDGGVKLALFEGGTQKVQIGMDGNARLWLASAGSGANGVDIYTGSSNTAAPSLRFRVDAAGTTNIYGGLATTTLTASSNISTSAQVIAETDVIVGESGGATYNTLSDGQLYFSDDDVSDKLAYSIGLKRLDNIGGNYTKLNIDWHTGITLGAATAYGGTRFLANSVGHYNNTTTLFSVGEGDNHTRFYYDLKQGSTTVIDSSRNLVNIGTISSGATTVNGLLTVGGTAAGTEGGELRFTFGSSTTLSGSTLNNDLAGNNVRWFESGGNTRGAYIDISTCGNNATSKIWHSGNDGAGSGLNADLLDGLDLHTGRNNEVNKVVRTDVNGYIQAGWINTTSGATSSTLTRIYCSEDGYIRYQSPANFGVSISPHINYNTIANKPTIPTNNNQLTNGAGYITTSGTANQSHMVSGSAFGTTSSPSSVLEYQQAASQTDTRLAPSTNWHNTIRMGHGNPYNYYSNTLAMQMTGSGAGQIKTQLISNNVAQGWRTVWDSTNDGAGSGLHADLLDGQHGSYYYSSANYPPQTSFENIYNNLSSNTGSGANLNSTFTGAAKSGNFDVWSGSNMPPSTTHVQGVQVRHSTSTHYGWQLASQYNQPGKMYLRNVSNSTFYTWHTMWSSANDGPGSGLDADTVDGIEAASTIHKFSNTGYYRPDTWIDFQSSNGAGLYWAANTGAGWHIHPTSTAIMRMRSGSSTQCYLDMNANGTTRGYVYANNSNQIGFLDYAGAWLLKSEAAGSTYLGGTQQMRINSSSTTAIVEGSSTYLVFRNTGSGAISFQKSGGTALGEFTNSGNLNVLGNVTAYGSPSDINLKENIETISNAIEKVQKLDGVTFNYKKDGGRSTGLIAQQLQEVLPEVVYTSEGIDGEEHLAVRYGNTVGLLVEAIKELKQEINELKAQLKET